MLFSTDNVIGLIRLQLQCHVSDSCVSVPVPAAHTDPNGLSPRQIKSDSDDDDLPNVTLDSVNETGSTALSIARAVQEWVSSCLTSEGQCSAKAKGEVSTAVFFFKKRSGKRANSHRGSWVKIVVTSKRTCPDMPIVMVLFSNCPCKRSVSHTS